MEEKAPIEVLIEIIEKYKLGPVRIFTDPEIEKRLEEIKSDEERIEFLKNLPSFKLAEILRRVESKEIPKKDLKEKIKEELNLDEDLSNEIAKEIMEKILKEKLEKSPKKIEEKETEDIYREPKEIKDIYREPIE